MYGATRAYCRLYLKRYVQSVSLWYLKFDIVGEAKYPNIVIEYTEDLTLKVITKSSDFVRGTLVAVLFGDDY